MTELDLYRGASLDDRWKYTQTLAAAQGLLPSSISAGNPQAIAARTFFVTETGDMLGIHPLAAIQGVNVIEGKPTLAPALMSALVRRAGHRIRVHRRGSIEAGDYGVRVEVVRADDPDHTFAAEWTPARAIRAGLVQRYERGADGVYTITARSRNGNAGPWEKYTEAMLYARALSEVSREAAEDVLFGVHYTPEELGVEVDAEGQAVDLGDATVARSVPSAPAPEPSAMPRKRATNGSQGVRAPQPSAPAPEAPADPEPANVAEAAAEPAREAVPPSAPAPDPSEPVDAEEVPAEPVDEGPAAVLDESAPVGPSEYEIARDESPDDWNRQALAAVEVEDLRAVWDGASAAGAMTDDLRRTITLRVNAARARQA